jgi:hypothetical protein
MAGGGVWGIEKFAVFSDSEESRGTRLRNKSSWKSLGYQPRYPPSVGCFQLHTPNT